MRGKVVVEVQGCIHKAGYLYCRGEPGWTDKLYICIHEISKVRKDIEMDMEKLEKENAELGKGNRTNEFRIRAGHRNR